MTKTPPGKSQLAKLAHAHKPTPRAQTPRKEDYVEVIYELIHEKGYAKPVDIAKNLHVTPPTVIGMPNKLREEQFIVHEKYGGIVLTEKGSSMADEIRAQKDTEGLEHYIDTRTLGLLARLVEYANKNPQWWNQFQKHPENI